MGTVTAQILIGESHPNDGGIIPEWALQVSENSRPHFLLHNNAGMMCNPTSIRNFRRYGWVPNPDHCLEDMLSMIALHVIKHPPLVNEISTQYPAMLRSNVEAYEAPGQILELLYNGIKEIQDWPKIVISIFHGCFLEMSASKLEAYPMDYEICKTIKMRQSSPWTKDKIIL